MLQEELKCDPCELKLDILLGISDPYPRLSLLSICQSVLGTREMILNHIMAQGDFLHASSHSRISPDQFLERGWGGLRSSRGTSHQTKPGRAAGRMGRRDRTGWECCRAAISTFFALWYCCLYHSPKIIPAYALYLSQQVSKNLSEFGQRCGQ